MLLIVLLPIYLNDTLAYVFGRLFGKTPLIPSVSPKKTREGFIGGMIGAAAVMLGILYFTGAFTKENALAIAGVSVLASILATLGDLFESKLKRSIDIKDSGNILPGHGGILDRIDAMLFVAPVLYVLLILI
ncbi:Phosphatidate cytidylyltransferase [compost metagenome]